MSSFLSELSTWIQTHQPLVVAVGVPILTAISAGFVSVFVTRMNLITQRSEQELQKRIWVLDQERKNLEQLKELFIEFSTVTFTMHMQAKNPYVDGESDKIKKSDAIVRYNQIIGLICRSNLMAGFDDFELEKIEGAMWYELTHGFEKVDENEVDMRAADERFAAVSRRVIARLQQKLYEKAAQ